MREEVRARLGVSDDDLAKSCQRWKITELSVFGSVLRDDFGPDGDIDLPVRYAPDVRCRLADHARLEEELTSMLGRNIDLCSRLGIEHSRKWLLKKIILESAEMLYESRLSHTVANCRRRRADSGIFARLGNGRVCGEFPDAVCCPLPVCRVGRSSEKAL